MKRALYPAMIMLLGVLCATVLAFALASTWRSFNHLWLMPLAFLPAIGVAVGCWLTHRFSGGREPWPITAQNDQIFFVLMGSVGSVAASYFVFIAISSVWFDANFIEMVFTPSRIKAFSESSRYGQHEGSLFLNMIGGLLVGSYGTFRFIREKLF